MASRVLPSWLEDMTKRSENARKQIPEALLIQKRKFLIAINKCDEQESSKEDEEFVKKVMDDLNQNFLLSFNRQKSCPWYDSMADTFVNNSLEENALFELSKYLDCARLVFGAYSGTRVNNVPLSAAYVLRHARQFGDTSKTIFQTNDDVVEASNKDSVSSTPAPLPDTKFMNKVEQLIADLRSVYDETKFRILNTNTTYITLLMLRRVVKNEAECKAAFQRIHTHDSYVKLCPWPLDNQLPKSDTSKLLGNTLKNCFCLVIHAYLNTDDERTKRALRVTCVQHFEWNGLQLPNLFFKVVELYEIDAGILWDHLSIQKTAKSLMVLANEYYEKYHTSKNDPTKAQRWFPYCRALNGSFHQNLSASQNNVICLILAYLVDLKIGFDKSTMRLSHWAKSHSVWKESCHKFAEELHKKMIYNEPTES